MSITAWLASLTLSRTCIDSVNCSCRSASVMPSATSRGSMPMSKSRVLVSPLAVMRTVYLPVGDAGPRAGCAAHMIMPGNTVAPS